MLFQIPTQVFVPCLPAILTVSLFSSALSSHAQPKPKPTAPPDTTLKAPPKPTKDWLVQVLLEGSILVAGIGAVLVIKRSPPPITEAPEPILHKPPEPQPTITITASKAELPAQKPWRSNSPTTPVNSPASIELEEPTLELANKPDSETTTIATTVRMPKVSVMDSLVHELRNPDPAKRHKAIWELGRSGDSRAVQPMVDLLLD